MKKWIPLAVAAAMALWILAGLRPRPDHGFAFSEFGRLPLMANGRFQPMDSVARNSLLLIREKQSANLEPWKEGLARPKILPAIEWLAAVTMTPEVADGWPVFRVDHPELISELSLPEKDAGKRSDGKHYSWNQIQPSFTKLERETTRVSGIEESHRTPYDRAVLKLERQLTLYVGLKNALVPVDAADWPRDLAEFESLVAARDSGVGSERLAVFLRGFDAMTAFDPPLVVPPHHPERSTDEWMRMGDALKEAARTGKVHEAARDYAAMAAAFRAGDTDGFNRAVAAYRTSLAASSPRELAKAGRELLFNRLQPFYAAMVV